MKVGDVIKLNVGAVNAQELTSPYVILMEKISRSDGLEYDWGCLSGDRYIVLGRQIEGGHIEVVSEVGY